MEAKKNPDKDLTRKSGQFFLIGLSISISLMITAFEWRTQKVERPRKPTAQEDSAVLIDIPITTLKAPAAPEVSIPKKEIIILGEFIPVESDRNSSTSDLILSPEDAYPLQSEFILVDEKEIPEEDPIVFAEVQPQPIGGLQNFYDEISREIKYPQQARRMNIEGKVLVEFVVNKKGGPSDLKILKGIGAGCDEEAMRVIASTKWEPGKQRGIPVRVRMVMPVFFKLN